MCIVNNNNIVMTFNLQKQTHEEDPNLDSGVIITQSNNTNYIRNRTSTTTCMQLPDHIKCHTFGLTNQDDDSKVVDSKDYPCQETNTNSEPYYIATDKVLHFLCYLFNMLYVIHIAV
jgi:hypothetical protein